MELTHNKKIKQKIRSLRKDYLGKSIKEQKVIDEETAKLRSQLIQTKVVWSAKSGQAVRNPNYFKGNGEPRYLKK